MNLALWAPPWTEITQAAGPVEVVAAVLTGRIVPRSTHQDARDDLGGTVPDRPVT